MKKLTLAGFERARNFIKSQARPLEKAIFALEFEGASVEDVLVQLAKFQNPDGGFGQVLEPDLRTPVSSALCTEMGLRNLAERQTSADHPMVQAAVKYLRDCFNSEAQVWRVIPKAANDAPHAPWWHDEAGSLAHTFDDFLVIPRAGILASLYHYAELIPAEWLAAVTEKTICDIERLDTEKFGGGGDTLVFALRLAQAPGLARTHITRILPRLRAVAEVIVSRDPQTCTSYSAPPLKLVPTPVSPIADLFADELQLHLDYQIEQQSPEGSWEPTWSWGNFYPEEWPQAKHEWCGILTLEMLLALRAFNRISV